MSAPHLCNICCAEEGNITCPLNEKCTFVYCSECFCKVKETFGVCSHCNSDLLTASERHCRDTKKIWIQRLYLGINILLLPFYFGCVAFTIVNMMYLITFPIEIWNQWIIIKINQTLYPFWIVIGWFLSLVIWAIIVIRYFSRLIKWISDKLLNWSVSHPFSYQLFLHAYILLSGSYQWYLFYQIKEIFEF